MARLFQSDLKGILTKLTQGQFSSSQERNDLLTRLAASERLRPKDVVWMLFRPDRAFREAAVAILKRLRDLDTVGVLVAECHHKPEAAVRSASAVLFGLGIPGLEQRLVELLAAPQPDTQETVRKILLEAPVSKTLQPVLWQLATTGKVEDRVLYLNRLATQDIPSNEVPRWQQLAKQSDGPIKGKALETLAQKAPAAAVDLLVEELPNAAYSTQQVLVTALTGLAAGQGAAFADRLLPLMASGGPAIRSAVIKILLGISDRAQVVKRYILFAKTLAGWARDRALESMKAFGSDLLEPTIALLADPDEDVRGSAMIVATSFEDPRIVPVTIGLLTDSDWWIQITAAETLGRLKDKRAVEPLVAALQDPNVRWSAVEALGRIGDVRALPALAQLLNDPAPEVRIEVLQAVRHLRHPQAIAILEKVATSDESRAVRARAVEMVEEVAQHDEASQSKAAAIRAAALKAKIKKGEKRLHALLIATRNQSCSDFHLSVSQPPIVRFAAGLARAQGDPFTAAQTEAMLREILTDAQWEKLEREQQLDFCYYIPDAGRYRANVFLDQKGYNAVFRVIPDQPPTIADLGLPPHLSEIADFHQGLVVVCGPTGSGKSTTLAALVNLFNETRYDHILTMEDPVEVVHPFKSCLVNQREVGAATQSFARALRAALREDPDVIVIGEMRDNETISLALTAAETGHIVLGTLNSTSAPKAVDGIIASFPVDQQAQIRTALSESLKYVISQRLLPTKEGRGQVACFEVLKGTLSIANLIRDEKTFQIYSAMQIGRSQGMQTFDDALKELLKAGKISAEAAYLAADKKEDYEELLPASSAAAAAP